MGVFYNRIKKKRDYLEAKKQAIGPIQWVAEHSSQNTYYKTKKGKRNREGGEEKEGVE